MLNILLLGSGGRENALAWKMAQSPLCGNLFIAPGNPGTELYGANVSLSVNDFSAIGKFCLDENIDMLVVGPEDPLVNGITDYFLSDNSLKKIQVIGPDKRGAMLEGSKSFAKEFMLKYSIPSAAYRSFSAKEINEGKKFLSTFQPPYVIKADGLAAGKGVVIAQTKAEAENVLDEMLLQSKFGEASSKVVIEQFLRGIEMSAFVLTDGVNYKIIPEAKDYKRIGENDTGPNTGGMGAVSPVPFADAALLKNIEEKVIVPTMKGLKAENILYKGFIFFGLMIVDKEPFVIEYNCRMGDPETEVVMPRIKTDLVELFIAVSKQKLSEIKFEKENPAAATVMLVSGGYPDKYEKGKIITGIEETKDVLLFHAGTSTNPQEKLITSGGRVVAVTSTGKDLKSCLEKCYSAAEKIKFDKMYYRKDIGKDVL